MHGILKANPETVCEEQSERKEEEKKIRAER